MPGPDEAYRNECEARYWLSFPLRQRQIHIQRIEKRRGKAAAEKLKREMARQWAESRRKSK